jgi:SNF2 family DNA or RNA helicase
MYYGSRDERNALQMEVEDGNLGKVDVFLTTYTTVINNADRKWLYRQRAEYLVVDEAHEIRNSDSLRHKALNKLGTARRLMLTGTPLHNNLHELCSLLYFLNPTLFGTFAAFSKLVEGMLNKKEESKEAAIEAIRAVLAPFILRRLKNEVLQLPDKKKFKVKSELSELLQQQVYQSVLAGGKAEWNDKGETVRGSTNILMSLRQVIYCFLKNSCFSVFFSFRLQNRLHLIRFCCNV